MAPSSFGIVFSILAHVISGRADAVRAAQDSTEALPNPEVHFRVYTFSISSAGFNLLLLRTTRAVTAPDCCVRSGCADDSLLTCAVPPCHMQEIPSDRRSAAVAYHIERDQFLPHKQRFWYPRTARPGSEGPCPCGVFEAPAFVRAVSALLAFHELGLAEPLWLSYPGMISLQGKDNPRMRHALEAFNPG